jgi:hypothetical protein
MVGQDKVADVDEPGVPAEILRDAWDEAVLTTLEAKDWNFARITRSLNAHGTPPARWSFQYAMPSDCARPLFIEGHTAERPIPMEEAADIDGTLVLLTDHEQASLVYTKNDPEIYRMTASFREALALKLASEVVMYLTEDERRKDLAIALYKMALPQAWAVNASRNVIREDFVDPFSGSR